MGRLQMQGMGARVLFQDGRFRHKRTDREGRSGVPRSGYCLGVARRLLMEARGEQAGSGYGEKKRSGNKGAQHGSSVAEKQLNRAQREAWGREGTARSPRRWGMGARMGQTAVPHLWEDGLMAAEMRVSGGCWP